MRILKILAGLLALSVLLFLFVANFSATESRYECSGEITSNETVQPAKLFFKLERYRWWVSLWSDSKDAAWVEVPNQTVSYFGHVSESGDFLHFSDSTGKFVGNFSTLSHTIGVSLGAFRVFDGSCKEISQ